MTVLFIGFGSIAKKHKNALLAIYPDAVIYALRSKKNADPIPGVINIYDWAEIPAHTDFAVICTPTFLHTEALQPLIRNRIPVMLEKPIASSLDGLDQLSEKIIETNSPVYIACNLRFLPLLKYLKKHIENNNPFINEVNVYAGSYLPAWRPGIDFKKNYSAHPEMGGGVHLDLFHELDYTRWIFGLPAQSRVLKRNVSSLKINAFDYALYIWEFKTYTATILLNYYRPDARRNIEIVFENEVWNADILANEIRNSKNELLFKSESGIADTYIEQMKYFTNCINNNQAPLLNTFRDSLEILKALFILI